MGTVFLLTAFFVSIAFGVICLLAGGICAIIFGIRLNKKKRAAKPLFITSLCIAGNGIISLIMPFVVIAAILIYGGVIMPMMYGESLLVF